jgi:hypothetical protein
MYWAPPAAMPSANVVYPRGAELTLVRDRDPLAVRTTSMGVPSQMTNVEAVFRLVNRHLRLPVHFGGVVSCYSSRVISSTLLRANSFAWRRGLTRRLRICHFGRCWTCRPAAPRPTADTPPGAWGGHVTGSAERGDRPSRTGGASCGHRRARQSRPVTTAPNARHEHATRHRIAAETFARGGGRRRAAAAVGPGRDVATSARRWAKAARPGPNRYCVYTYPSGKAIKAVTATVKTICRRTVNSGAKHHRIAFHCGRSLVGAPRTCPGAGGTAEHTGANMRPATDPS